jgi:hypothetical protein
VPEIKREPIKIKVGGVEYDAFDEDHTVSDILRYAMREENVTNTNELPSIDLEKE